MWGNVYGKKRVKTQVRYIGIQRHQVKVTSYDRVCQDIEYLGAISTVSKPNKDHNQ